MCLHFHLQYKNEAKTAQIWPLPSCAGDGIWSQILCGRDLRSIEFPLSNPVVNSTIECEHTSFHIQLLNMTSQPFFYSIE